jgi:hypothetical protein
MVPSSSPCVLYNALPLWIIIPYTHLPRTSLHKTILQTKIFNFWYFIHSFNWHVHNATIPCRPAELNDLYSLPNIVRVVKSRRMRWAMHVARMGEDRGVYRVLVGKPEGKRSLGRPRRRWEDNIKIDLQEVGGGRGDWMELAQDRDRWRALVGTVRNFRVP